mmetsp:Transcript_21123/g.29597  ORF Transcript_21123/g.29597 Transcript_21123/m.29597 type:complete len:234 (+) Transcript_21123:32-733(+)|eukprot:CAMPEP_0184870200 /NCGR_PEP_ID=MMETSP0580-20130426/36827_1 /TAXON_ID=1118495 /ORGANISM="Dactyliosolen fragilissimus" /LENGTH=233 /DNA_ID=CAMNT_0027372175 /DNA_START=23 /DNA_END=724 /DNA_ORIENTATION=-
MNNNTADGTTSTGKSTKQDKCEHNSHPNEVQDIGKSTNIAWHDASITREDICKQRRHKSCILWFTGLSGSGKSTLANAVHKALFQRCVSSYILDGDNIRHGLCSDLGFSDSDRTENIRRIGEVSKLFLDAGFIVSTAFVSPFIEDRDRVRSIVDEGDFIEIHCAASLETCENRDTKGLYAKARAGVVKDFTGISSPYESPLNPELKVDTGNLDISKCCDLILQYLQNRGIITD